MLPFHSYRGEAAALFKHHTAPVTSVEWHPSDSTVFASAGDDNQVSPCTHPFCRAHTLHTPLLLESYDL